MRKAVVTSMIILLPLLVFGQQPFEEYGYKVKVGTLSGGKYVEFFDQDSLVEVGSVVLNANTGRIVGFITYDTVYSEATLQPEIISRWMSPDPLSHKFFSYSPYHFSGNNPVRFVDPDGRAFIDYYDQSGSKIGTDGNNDGRVVVVKDKSEVKSIKATDKAGGTTASGDVKSGVELPSAFVRKEMGNAVTRAGQPTSDDKKGNFHEEGGMFGMSNGQEKVIAGKPGAYSDPAVAKVATMDPFSGESPGNTLDEIMGTYHTHPSGTNGNASFDQSPSNTVDANGQPMGDIPTAISTSNPSSAYHVTGNSYVLGTGNNTVTIYNASGTVATFPLKQFISIGVKP